MRTVRLLANLTEEVSPLPGSRAWVAVQIETGELRITTTKKENRPAVFLTRQAEVGGKSVTQWQLLADFGLNPIGSGNEFDCWPFWDDCMSDQATLFSQALSPAGRQLTKDFARKCRTLLKLSLRRADKSDGKPLKVKITNGRTT